MKKDPKLPGRRDEKIIIAPIPFRSGPARPPSLASSRRRWLLAILIGALFMGLLGAAGFVFTARQVAIRVRPEPDRLAIRGTLWAPRLRGDYLLRPGEYTLQAAKPGYHPLERTFQVTAEKNQSVIMTMEKRPGRLTLTAHQADRPEVVIKDAEVYLDDQPIGKTPLEDVAVKPGIHALLIRAANYLDLQTRVDVEGMDQPQALDLALVPGWAEIALSSDPQGAAVHIDGQWRGRTPLTLDLPAGSYDLQVGAAGYKTWQTSLEVQANQPRQLDPIRLMPADGLLALRTRPAGASVTLDDKYVGQTPLEIPLTPDSFHVVRIAKPGYANVTRRIKLAAAESKEVALALAAQKGVVHLEVQPAGAQLAVDGKSQGTVPARLELLAVEHQLEISKEGFESFTTRITPRPGFPQKLTIVLQSRTAAPKSVPAAIRAFNGYPLKLIHAGAYTMGSSRREQGRRSNETLRRITLQRPFYMGLREVTNGEFRAFLRTHDSGSFKTQDLNRGELPVVRVTWEQAALFCNWLSAKESLPPVYVRRDDQMVAARPLGGGYRLPTEAEWEYCARFENSRAERKYPWGDSFPPPPESANLADSSARDLLPVYLAGYNDGYPAAAPPAAFKPNALGLHDLAGNVAEWCHDFYSIYSYSAANVFVDPVGPGQGRHWVVRGSSWQDAGISELRAAYRSYSNKSRPDLGLRVCRYAN
ncbi:MAG: PEGA domain-containing protein [Desulfobacterales bacterium]|nr:MAG: PEGA domain-containing protein [Desulfobacterales bacterium]